ncbi:WD repeat-containing protein [Acrasis kona]|uniref:WD repeat-containing protein n=1 Tax=Acrasis kona TaxID=1008807 RepID=A0AAW2ZSR3_9EUKA
MELDIEFHKLSLDYVESVNKRLPPDTIPKDCKQIIQCGDIVYCALVVEEYVVAAHPHTRSIQVYSRTGQIMRSIDVDAEEVWEMVRVGSDKILCASAEPKGFVVVDWKTGVVLNKISHTSSVTVGGHNTLLCFGPSMQYLAACMFDGTLTVWDISVQGGKIIKQFKNDEGHWTTCVEVLPNGKLITGNSNGELHIWDFKSCSMEATLHGHKGPINCARLLSSNLLVTGGFDRSIQLWDINNKSRTRVVCTGSGSIRQIYAVSTNYIYSVSTDNTLRLWELSQNQCVKTLKGHSLDVVSVDVSKDGIIVSASKDKTIRLWM